jgi:hypothetical protein
VGVVSTCTRRELVVEAQTRRTSSLELPRRRKPAEAAPHSSPQHTDTYPAPVSTTAIMSHAQVGVRVVRVRRKQAELSKNARLRKRLQKLRESSRKLLGIHKVAPEPTFDDKLDALFARYDTDHNNLIDADELVKLLEHFIPPHVRRGKRPGWPSLADAHFILGEVDIDGDEQTISRDELRAAVNLWRRLIAETTPSQSDQLRMHGRMGFCCEVM